MMPMIPKTSAAQAGQAGERPVERPQRVVDRDVLGSRPLSDKYRQTVLSRITGS